MALTLDTRNVRQDWPTIIRQVVRSSAEKLESGGFVPIPPSMIEGYDADKVRSYVQAVNRTLEKFPALREAFYAHTATDDADASRHAVLVKR